MWLTASPGNNDQQRQDEWQILTVTDQMETTTLEDADALLSGGNERSLLRETSIPACFVKAVLANCDRYGVDPMRMLERAGCQPDVLTEPMARVSVTRFAKLQTITMLEMRDESLGYVEQRHLPGTWANMCHSVIHCTTLGHALHRFSRFFQMFDFGIDPHLEIDGEEARLIVRPTHPEQRFDAYVYELLMFNAHRFGSWLVRQHLPLKCVNLRFDSTPSQQHYRDMFLAQPVFFGQPDHSLVFHASLMDLPIVQTPRSLTHFLRHPNLVLLAQQYENRSWTSRVQALIRRNLEELPSIEAVGEQLNVHPQTLRRRLASEASSYNDIKTLCRRDAALHYLGRSNLSIEEIAARTGFSESSAFTRAFKNWTGLTPQSYRRQV